MEDELEQLLIELNEVSQKARSLVNRITIIKLEVKEIAKSLNNKPISREDYD